MAYQFLAQLPELFALAEERLQELEDRFNFIVSDDDLVFSDGYDLNLDSDDDLVFLPKNGWRTLLRELSLDPKDFQPVASDIEQPWILLARTPRPVVELDRRYRDCHGDLLNQGNSWSPGNWPAVVRTLEPYARRCGLGFRVSYHEDLVGLVPVSCRRQIDCVIGALPYQSEVVSTTVWLGKTVAPEAVSLRHARFDSMWADFPIWNLCDFLGNVVAQVIGRTIYLLVDIFGFDRQHPFDVLAWILDQTVPILAARPAEQTRVAAQFERQRALLFGEAAFLAGWLAGHSDLLHQAALRTEQKRAQGSVTRLIAQERRLLGELDDVCHCLQTVQAERAADGEVVAKRLADEIAAITRFPLVTKVEIIGDYLVFETVEIISALLRDTTRRNFGRLRCHLPLCGGSDNRVETLDRPVANAVHPHVSDGRLCLGNYQQPIIDVHLPAGQLALAVTMFLEALININESEPGLRDPSRWPIAASPPAARRQRTRRAGGSRVLASSPRLIQSARALVQKRQKLSDKRVDQLQTEERRLRREEEEITEKLLRARRRLARADLMLRASRPSLRSLRREARRQYLAIVADRRIRLVFLKQGELIWITNVFPTDPLPDQTVRRLGPYCLTVDLTTGSVQLQLLQWIDRDHEPPQRPHPCCRPDGTLRFKHVTIPLCEALASQAIDRVVRLVMEYLAMVDLGDSELMEGLQVWPQGGQGE